MLQFVLEIVAHGKRQFAWIFECVPAVYLSGEDCPRGARSELYDFLFEVGLIRFICFFLVADLCEGTFFARHMSHCPVCVQVFSAHIVVLGFADLVGLREDVDERVVREVWSLMDCLGAFLPRCVVALTICVTPMCMCVCTFTTLVLRKKKAQCVVLLSMEIHWIEISMSATLRAQGSPMSRVLCPQHHGATCPLQFSCWPFFL